jgi:hypothetical protein
MTQSIDLSTTVSISVQYIFLVYSIPFTSDMRFLRGQYDRLSISAARGRRKPEVTSPFDSSTMVSC